MSVKACPNFHQACAQNIAFHVRHFDATRLALRISGQLGGANLTTSPRRQQPQQKRSIHVERKPGNSVFVDRAFVILTLPPLRTE
jgi:hypothetical protein